MGAELTELSPASEGQELRYSATAQDEQTPRVTGSPSHYFLLLFNRFSLGVLNVNLKHSSSLLYMFWPIVVRALSSFVEADWKVLNLLSSRLPVSI